MSGSNAGASWWLGGGSWHDRDQNHRLNELQSELAAQRAAQRQQQRQLKGELDHLQGTIAQRLDRLAESFEAFVELTDIRHELEDFQAFAEARYEARRVLSGLAKAAEQAGGRPVVDVTLETDVPEIPGYWLPPAVRALSAVVRDEPDPDAIAVARDHDASRTDLFLCLGLLLVGRPDAALEQLDILFTPTAGSQVTRAQRQLWAKAAAGTFGEAGRLLISARLRAAVTDTTTERTEDEVQKWRATVAALPNQAEVVSDLTTSPGRRSTGGERLPDELIAPVQASARLEAMRSWCEPHLAARAPAAPDHTDGRDKIFELLQELVDEGSEDERPLRERAVELRRVVDGETGDSEPRHHWDDPAGDPLDLLRADAQDADHPVQQQIALRAAAPLLGRVADQLAAEAAAPVPDSVELRASSHMISVDRRGVNSGTVDAAQETIKQRVETQTSLPNLLWPFAGAAALSFILGLLLLEPILFAAALGFASATVGYVVADRAERQKIEERSTHKVNLLTGRVDAMAEQVTDMYARASEAATSAPATRAAIEELLTAEGSAPLPPLASATPQDSVVDRPGPQDARDDDVTYF